MTGQGGVTVGLNRDGRIIMLIIVALLSPIAAHAQASYQEGKQEREHDLSSLQLKLSTAVETLCIASPFNLDVEVVNAGQRDVKINKNALWITFLFRYTSPEGKIEHGEMGEFNHLPKKHITLRPGRTYREARKFSWSMFKSPGSYAITLYYHTVKSNEVKFDLYECKPKEVNEQK